MRNLAFMTHFQVPFCGASGSEIFHRFGMRTEDEIIRIKLQHDAEGKPRPHAELLYIAFSVFQALILPDLNADQGGDLLLRQPQLYACLTDDFMFPGDTPVLFAPPFSG